MADVGFDQPPEFLLDALAARDNFIAAVSHELRNTVAPLILLAEQFQAVGGSMTPEQLQTKIALLTRNLHKFVATVDRVTEVAQLRDGRLELDFARVDASEVVEYVVSQQQRLADAGGIDLVVRAPYPMVGRWDRTRLVQIVTNLTTNAIRFGVGGEVEIEVASRGADIEISVRDHGPGIAPHELAGIFDRFDHRRSRTAGGFGVGLFIVKTLASAMGGRATAANAPGGGARFSVVLPRG
jgi:signal transduction histidine kinase